MITAEKPENTIPQLNVSAQDVLAAIAFEAQRIVSAAQQHAAGYPFPNPELIKEVLDRMASMNNVLLQVGGLISDKTNAGLTSSSAMKAEFN